MKRTTDITLRVTFDDEQVRTHPYHWDWSLMVNIQGVYVDAIKSHDHAPTPEQPVTLETLSPAHLFLLIYDAANAITVPPRSIHPNDHPIERVLVIPHNLGKFLAELDPTESLFHVEFWAPYAEVWSARAWRESITRRLRHKPNAAQDDLVTLKQYVLGQLIHAIGRVAKCSHDRAEQTAQALIHFGDQYDAMLDLINIAPELKAKLLKLRALLATNQTTTNEAKDSPPIPS